MDSFDSVYVLLEPPNPVQNGQLIRMKSHEYLNVMSQFRMFTQVGKSTKATSIEHTDRIGCGCTTRTTQTENYQENAATDPVQWPRNNVHTQTTQMVRDFACNVKISSEHIATDTAGLVNVTDACCGTTTLKVSSSSINTAPTKRSSIVLPFQRSSILDVAPNSIYHSPLIPNTSPNLPRRPMFPRSIMISLGKYKEKRKLSSNAEKVDNSTQTDKRLDPEELERFRSHFKRLKNLFRAICSRNPTDLNKYTGRYLDYLIQLTKTLGADVAVIEQDKLENLRTGFQKSSFWELTSNPNGKLPKSSHEKNEKAGKASKRTLSVGISKKDLSVAVRSRGEEQHSSAKRCRLEDEIDPFRKVQGVKPVTIPVDRSRSSKQDESRHAKSQSSRSPHRRSITPSTTSKHGARNPSRSKQHSKRRSSRSRSPRPQRQEFLYSPLTQKLSLKNQKKLRERSTASVSKNHKQYSGPTQSNYSERYFSQCTSSETSPESRDPRLCRKLSKHEFTTVSAKASERRSSDLRDDSAADGHQCSVSPCGLKNHVYPKVIDAGEAETAAHHAHLIQSGEYNADSSKDSVEPQLESPSKNRPLVCSSELLSTSEPRTTVPSPWSWLKDIQKNTDQGKEEIFQALALPADQLQCSDRQTAALHSHLQQLGRYMSDGSKDSVEPHPESAGKILPHACNSESLSPSELQATVLSLQSWLKDSRKIEFGKEVAQGPVQSADKLQCSNVTKVHAHHHSASDPAFDLVQVAKRITRPQKNFKSHSLALVEDKEFAPLASRIAVEMKDTVISKETPQTTKTQALNISLDEPILVINDSSTSKDQFKESENPAPREEVEEEYSAQQPTSSPAKICPKTSVLKNSPVVRMKCSSSEESREIIMSENDGASSSKKAQAHEKPFKTFEKPNVEPSKNDGEDQTKKDEASPSIFYTKPWQGDSFQTSLVSGPQGSSNTTRGRMKKRVRPLKKRKSNNYGYFSRISTQVTHTNNYGGYSEFPFTVTPEQEYDSRDTQMYSPEQGYDDYRDTQIYTHEQEYVNSQDTQIYTREQEYVNSQDTQIYTPEPEYDDYRDTQIYQPSRIGSYNDVARRYYTHNYGSAYHTHQWY